jgi:hypothetical protein
LTIHTDEDKRHAAEMLLADPERFEQSNRWIGRQAGISDKTVGKYQPHSPSYALHPPKPPRAKPRKIPKVPEVPHATRG